jgi:peptidoglycan/xylan/chitin deacetylase (PgdA/CDA1 family)
MIYFSVDLEYWNNSSILKDSYKDTIPDYLYETVDFILKNLKETHNKATFFVLGEVCEKYPELIRKISQNGHDIGFHSYDHVLLHRKKPEDYYNECIEGKKMLESITGKQVFGHRAPAWSFTDWLPDVLERAGFLYDSSINEIRFPGLIKTNLLKIKQYPIRNFGFGIFSIPFAGSIFFRILPYFIIRLIIRYNEKKH